MTQNNECDLGAQLGFLRGRHIPVEKALAALDQYVRPGFPKDFHFHIDAWADKCWLRLE